MAGHDRMMKMAQRNEFETAIPEKKVAFYRITKVASQSIAKAFLDGTDGRTEWVEPDASWRIGVAVRDPADRLLSGYANRICCPVLRIEPMNGVSANMAFCDFVDAVCNLPDSALDVHFRPQTAFIKHPPTHVLRFETLEDDWNRWRGDLPPLPHRNKSNRPDALTPELRRKIFNRYAADAARFGYEA